MGNFGCNTSVKDLPPDSALLGLLRQAKKLNDEGVRVPKKAAARKPPAVPKELAAALRGNAKANAAFRAFPPSHKREYIEWITEAKTAQTRERRISTALEWMAEGKSRNWKYMKK